MRYCPNCHVHVRGDRESCPLCHNIIQTEGVPPAFTPYPDMPLEKERTTILQLVSYVALASVIVSLLSFSVWHIRFQWPLLTMFAMGSLWIIAWDMWAHHQVERGIVCFFVAASIFTFCVDRTMGGIGWSLNYIVPFLLMVNILVLVVSVRVLHIQAEDYLLEWLAAGLVGMLPYLFIKCHWVEVILPSFICVTLAIVFFLGLCIFRGGAILAVLDRRWHI